MPNQHNIEAPVILISMQRSGTTLVHDIFRRHPDFNVVGETANLIFGIWHAVESTHNITSPLIEAGVSIPCEEKAVRIVRQAILTSFPADKPRWFQKPIGIPTVLGAKFDQTQWAEAGEWYWNVLAKAFPKAKYFAVLRHPCDVVLSCESFLGYETAGYWWSLACLASLLTHPASPVKYVIHYEDLVRHKEEVVRELFEFLEVPFDQKVLNAFAAAHAPSKGREKPGQTSLTRRDEWAQLDPTKTTPFYIEKINELFAQFGYPLEWPSHFTTENMAVAKAEDPQQTIQKLNRQIETLHFDYLSKIQNFYQMPLWRLAQKYLAYKYNLLKGKTLAKANHVYESLAWKR
ncbi:MAG: hypothetical protein BroJett011_45780 [Chloroflexota bacterium]|nr:MAG: hypothetical protein BroJett011_45780 [Chloroflexota bacterium]